MVDRIGDGTGMAKAAIEAALKRQAEALQRMGSTAGSQTEAAADHSSFASSLVAGLKDVDNSMQKNDKVVDDLLTGRIQDFHEAAVQIKQTDLAFRYTLEVRNKFVDAYREVMRMSV